MTPIVVMASKSSRVYKNYLGETYTEVTTSYLFPVLIDNDGRSTGVRVVERVSERGTINWIVCEMRGGKTYRSRTAGAKAYRAGGACTRDEANDGIRKHIRFYEALIEKQCPMVLEKM